MTNSVAQANDCGYQSNRNGHLRCALKHTFETFGGQAQLGLASFARKMSSCPPNTCLLSFGGCVFQDAPNNATAPGCGPEPSPATPLSASRAGANIIVPIVPETTPPQPSNLPALLSWVDNSCTGGTELFASGSSPLNGVLRDAFRYFSNEWISPFTSTAVPSPLTSVANGERPCRSVSVVFITDGNDTCDAPADVIDAAGDLLSGFSKDGITWNVKTFIVNFIDSYKADADTIAAAGGTFPSYLASDAAGLSLTLSSIIASNFAPETCDNADNDCNGCTDEGFTHYCDVGQACCLWASPQERTSCLALYKSSISPGLPNGDLTKLPCTTAAQQTDPATWLCYNPSEACDGVDNNCSGGADEGAVKCGNPAHCPQAEVCNGVDDNCDGSIDEGGVCSACVPSPEICDGCDNDCDGLTDDGIAPIACGLASPPWCLGQITCKPPQAVPPGGCVAGGGFNPCNNAPIAEVCNNGIDDNCNGQIDEGALSPCDPPGGPYNYGPNSHCKQGIKPCNLNVCQGAVGPEVEVCDGIDNDCDGQVDEGALSVGQACGQSQPPCSPGATACVGGALVCQGGISPAPEVCDGIDNNCDGEIDETPLADGPAAGEVGCWSSPGNCCTFNAFHWCPPVGAECNGLGALSPGACLQGTLTCKGALGWACDGSKPPSEEVCDGIDNNCNGFIDDGNFPFVGQVCGTDEGECAAGTLACANGVVDCIGYVGPAPEVCDGKDNDCDANIDNGLPNYGPCTPPFDQALYPDTPTGVALLKYPCQPGHFECNFGALDCIGGIGPSPELCDGIDNDCDGVIDETGAPPNGLDGTDNLVPPPNARIGDPCGVDVGNCKTGAYACVNASFACQGATGPELEVCDGVDNDCDGEIDNNAACVEGKRCVQAAGGYQCAAPCPPELPCPPEQHCEKVISDGAPGLYCVANAPDATGTSSSSSGSTGSGGGGGAGIDSSNQAPWGLATGGGGCSCEVPSSGAGTSKMGAILSLFIASSILRRRRAGPTEPRKGPRTPGRFERSLRATAALLLGLTLSVLVSGCSTEAFCFGDCESIRSGGAGGQGGATSAGGAGQGGGGAACVPTNGGVDVCDGLDNDCDGIIDRGPGINFEAASSCGTCDNDCTKLLTNCIVDAMHCLPSAHPGDEAGTCTCGKCEDGYYDIDKNGSCEYYCVMGPTPEDQCNGKDDNCDGQIDEGVDFCTSTGSCGACGVTCVSIHGVSTCVHDGAGACDASNTHCAIESCTCDGPGDCWWDLDGMPGNGCEYQCDTTNGGVEICGDGLDNDCDGKIDANDDLSGDPQVGAPCFGDWDGECATIAHAGTTSCVGNQLACSGANVLHESDAPEVCNGKDDDCDGLIDESPTDVGGACGISNVAPCSFGTLACQSGSVVCLGAVDPSAEKCDGIDNDCDGYLDLTSATGSAPADSIGACNVPPPPPAGATSPCKAGMKACVGGVVTCQGSMGPSGPSDSCGVDANCDGQLTNQPNVANDAANCGACGNNCFIGAVHANWSCQSGACVFGGCVPGYYDLNNDNKCEYACLSNGPEQCNGFDDDCDGQIDEGILAIPTPAQICGVSPAALLPECTTGVAVACQNGAWKCTFPAGVCSPSCAAATEVCDGLDNNCNGALNENVPAYGKGCASDDASPVPGDGACKTLGTYVCDGPNAVKCSAVKADCSAVPGGCTELCDGIDNDCDGVTDEPFSAKGPIASSFVKPTVTKIGASMWIYSYEASRPNATAIAPGSGSGYACSAPNKKPWYNITGPEVEQTCQAQGGFICPTSAWTDACQASQGCSWGYFPRGGAGSACATSFTASKLCNLGPSFDFDPSLPGDQDGLLATASPLLSSCWADWSALNGNVASNDKIFDITGNLREITSAGGAFYSLMGGSFMTGVEAGAKCDNANYVVDANYQYLDVGFRCCFSSDPTQ